MKKFIFFATVSTIGMSLGAEEVGLAFIVGFLGIVFLALVESWIVPISIKWQISGVLIGLTMTFFAIFTIIETIYFVPTALMFFVGILLVGTFGCAGQSIQTRRRYY